MRNTILAIAAIATLGAGAVGCSSSGKTTSAAPTHGQTAKPATASAAPTPASSPTPTPATTRDNSCNDLRTAMSSTGVAKSTLDQMNEFGNGVSYKGMSIDNACFMVISTTAKPDDLQVKQKMQQAGSQMWTATKSTLQSESVKGVAITASDGSTVFYSSDPKQY